MSRIEGRSLTVTPESSGLVLTPVRLGEVSASDAFRCRCGTRLERGGPCVTYFPIPDALDSLLPDPTYCSPVCARAHVLEILEVVDSTRSSSLLSDLGMIYAGLAALFVAADASIAGMAHRPP